MNFYLVLPPIAAMIAFGSKGGAHDVDTDTLFRISDIKGRFFSYNVIGTDIFRLNHAHQRIYGLHGVMKF